LEHDVEQSVRALVSAATLNGQAPAGTIPDQKVLSRMLLTALGEQDVDGLLTELFPENEEAKEARVIAGGANTERMMIEAVHELRGALKRIMRQHERDS
jgi:hypothetical protein